ncbi:outer membrane beta-barrel domain-containing protein [Myxococcaceae bacterium GXIMD 01537]
MKPALRLLLSLCLSPTLALAQGAPAPEAKPASATAPAAAAQPASAKSAAAKPATDGRSSESEAGDVSEVDKDDLGPLRERIRPVSGHLFLKKGRFELSPSVTFSIRDAFFTKYILGGTLTYHPLETLGISLRGGYSLASVSGSAQLCTFGQDGTTRGCNAPSMEQLDGKAPGQVTLMGGLDVQWAPIYGKLSLLAEKFIHFDMYAVGGVSAVQYRGPPESGATTASTAQITPGANVGVGARFFLNRWMTVRTEVRDLIYVEKAVIPDQVLRNQLLFELGFSFFFPTAHPES